MLRPGFEPGSQAREARMIDRSTLSELGKYAKDPFLKILVHTGFHVF